VSEDVRSYVRQHQDRRHGHWFVGEGGPLYIIPLRGVIADSVGPDDMVEDELDRLIEAEDEVAAEDVERLGLRPIPACLKRFDQVDGYYHA
jgi:hypothetical protein